MSGFRDYQNVIQAGVRRGDATRRVPLNPEEVRAFFGRDNYFTFPDIHPNGWTVRKPRGTPEIDILDRAACSAML